MRCPVPLDALHSAARIETTRLMLSVLPLLDAMALSWPRISVWASWGRADSRPSPGGGMIVVGSATRP
jgi:hypothetical protein